MKFPTTIGLWLALALPFMTAGCGRNTPPPQGAGTRTDSTKSDSTKSDSSALATPASALLPDSNLTYEQRQGKVLYAKYCMVCHGEEGKGDGFNAFNLDPKPRDFTDARLMDALTDDRIAQTISGGGRSVNRSDLMPSWGGRLQKIEIGYLVSYIRQFAPHP